MWECPNCGHMNDDYDDECDWCGYMDDVNQGWLGEEYWQGR